jgi:hypothetical protein
LALWEWRLERLADSPSAEDIQELRGFGWVFAVDRFDARRSLDLLVRTLHVTGGLTDWDGGVVERLGKLATEYPYDAAESLAILVFARRDPWELWAFRKAAHPILATAMESGDPAARETAIRCINELGAKGMDDFRDLL